MSENREPMTLPLLPLRDVVVFPHMVIPLFVGRAKSIKALEAAMETAKQIMLVAQKSAQKDEPGIEDLYDVGCIATVLQMLKLPDGTVKVLVEGQQRARVLEALDGEAFMTAEVKPLPAAQNEDTEAEALRRALLQQFEQFVKLNKKIPPEVMASLTSMDDAGRLADSVTSHLPLKIEQKQEVLEMQSATARLEHLLGVLETEIDILQVEKRIRGRVKRQMEKSQREYYLNEQVKAIQKELGDGEETAELDVLDKKIKTSGISKEGREKAEAELKKLRLMSPMSAEATVVRNYLDALIGLPWKKKSKISADLAKAEEVLNDDHFGLDKVKERILEYLAVQQRVDKIKAPILCLVGPPGVGKTSLGQSIAKATNRKFVRLSLGGVRDESEIRGHRRTYIGSMPGRILQSLSKVGVRNPLFLLDEVDKMGMDFRGDPASALLEVLDPEQNHTFSDHYVEVDFDLSDVMFVATANSMNMPAPLLDRMEIIRLSGYTESEKVNIAQQYLLSKQLKNNGIQEGEVNVDVSALRSIIRYYTREAGVRSLEREISKLCRKVVRKVVLAKSKGEKIAKINITDKNLPDFLGVQKYTFGMAEKDNQIGQVNGLAWTEVGGDLLTVEVAVVGGKGSSKFTGKLGDVMQESVSAALTVVRKRAQRLGIQPSFHEKHDLHVHFPEGAIPKDGPSAGIAIATALVSALTEIPVRADVAMTGEITLRGEVLPIGGLKEKLLAAMRGGIKKVLIPHENVKDLSEMPQEVLSNLEIQPVRWIDEVLTHALERAPIALTDDQIIPPVAAVAAAAAVSGTSAATKH
jgi:ATP-dependent Lon protease